MWFALAGGLVVVALSMWAALKWRAFGAAEAKQRATRAARSDKYSRTLHSADTPDQPPARKPKRQFGRR